MILSYYLPKIYIFWVIYRLWRWHVEVISNLHVQGSKFGGRNNIFGGKSFQRFNSTEFMEFVFSKSVAASWRVLTASWQLMLASRRFMTAHNRFMTAHDVSWRLMTPSWQLLTASWRLMTIHNSSWRLHDDSLQLTTAYDGFMTIHYG